MQTNGLARRCTSALVESLEPRLLLTTAWWAPAQWSGLIDVPLTYEAESLGGTRNDTPADAQTLSFTSLTSRLDGPALARVRGQGDGVAFAGKYTNGSLLFGTWAAGTSYTTSFHATSTPGGAGLLTLTARADLAGESKYLRVWAEGFDLGTVFVDDGLTGAEVTATLEVPQAVLAVLAADGVISLTLTPSDAMTRVGTSYVAVDLSYMQAATGGTGDYYRIDLSAGQNLSLAVAGEAAGALDVQLVDENGTLLAAGVDHGDGTWGVTLWTAQVDGPSFVRIGGVGEYTFAVGLNLALDAGGNHTQALAQPLPAATLGRQWAMGAIDTPGDSDFYAMDLEGPGLLTLRVVPLDPAAAPQPIIRLYDAGGNLVAQSEAAVAGDEAWLSFHVPAGPGSYTIEVVSANGTTGVYMLETQLAPLDQPAPAWTPPGLAHKGKTLPAKAGPKAPLPAPALAAPGRNR